MPRRQKKSETLELRLSHEDKQAFMQACREQGRTASDTMRDFIASYLDQRSASPPQHWLKEMTTMTMQHKMKLAGLTLALATGLMLAQPQTSIATETPFERLDRDKDGVLTPGEIGAGDDELFAVLDKDSSGTITPDEFQTNTSVVMIRTNNDALAGGEGKVVRQEVRMIKIAEGDEAARTLGDEDQEAMIERILEESGITIDLMASKGHKVIVVDRDGEVTTTVEDATEE